MKLIVQNYQNLQHYQPIWQAMRELSEQRERSERSERSEQNEPQQQDQLWLMQHLPVFTLGQAGKQEHILNPHQIPVVRTDRGGQVTYHGPGQLMLYALLDIKRLGLDTRRYVRQLEQCVIDYLKQLGLCARNDESAPGVYLNGAKICSIGLRVRRGFSYHGLAFNVDLDLTPFRYINPCGYPGLRMTRLADHVQCSLEAVAEQLSTTFATTFGYQTLVRTNTP